jgi:lipopolysaccharide transport system ATP-binding protein
MSDLAIKVEHLSKRYILGGSRNRHEGLRHRIEDAFRNPLGFIKSATGNKHDVANEFWAVNDVSFDVKQGDVVGIVGRNGAGKSTLLKMLSRITEPTSGSIRIKGRIASLLEVGTGFHPELTGRENIYLNGAILGMSRMEIRSKFDEIVAFAETEKFLDTPVKRYSSGMYVRLAFAVAAHLEPEILIVDEVLAVGDSQFQKKCLGKMSEVARGGRTVLFVSHQIQAVTRLCNKALWLNFGKVKEMGPVADVCAHYMNEGTAMFSQRIWKDASQAPGDEQVRLLAIEANSDASDAGSFSIRHPVTITMKYRVLEGGKVIIPNVHLHGEDGMLIFVAHDWNSEWRAKPKPPGIYTTEFTVPGDFLNEGRISIRAALTNYSPFHVHVDVMDSISMVMVDSAEPGGARGDFSGNYPGIVRPVIPSKTFLSN